MAEQQQQQQASDSSSRPRIDWYQTDAYVSVSVFVKGVSEATASGVISDEGRTVTVSYELASSSGGGGGGGSCEERILRNFDLSLAHPVAPNGLQLAVKPTRLDIRLTKQLPGMRWAVLEGRDDSPAPAAVAASVAVISTDEAAAAAAAAPPPQHQAKNWDAIAKSIEDEKLEGDAALNDLFQKIFSDGTDEQKKAMVKSFTESGGTVLSTNWKEVGKSKVEVKPPDGMEFKKWDS